MKIPILDLADRGPAEIRTAHELARATDDALSTAGTFVLVGHGIPDDAAERLREAAGAFFARSVEEKRLFARPRTPEVARGWFGLPAGVVSALGMERYSFGPWVAERGDPYYFATDEARAHFPDNRFPRDLPEFEAAARDWLDRIQEVSRRVAVLFETALGLPFGALVDDLDGSTGTATAIHYPGAEIDPGTEGEVRIQAHNDVDLYTILRIFDDERTDLHFLDRDDRWNEVPAVPGGFVVNVGDLMQRYTNDRWLATSHKVLVPSRERAARDRFSVAYFEHPRYDARVGPLEAVRGDAPARYETVRVADFERQRRLLIHLGLSDPNAELLAPIEKRLGEEVGGV